MHSKIKNSMKSGLFAIFSALKKIECREKSKKTNSKKRVHRFSKIVHRFSLCTLFLIVNKTECTRETPKDLVCPKKRKSTIENRRKAVITNPSKVATAIAPGRRHVEKQANEVMTNSKTVR